MIYKKLFAIVPLLAALILMAGIPQAFAAGASQTIGGEIEFTGTVSRVGNGFIVVARRTVFVGRNTEVTGSLTVGTVVKVHVFRDGNGNLSAREVQAVNAPAPRNTAAAPEATPNPAAGNARETEFIGTVTSIGNGFIVVGGQTVFVGRNTEIKGQPAVGSVIKVHVFRDGNGNLSAREVEVAGGAGVGDDRGGSNSGPGSSNSGPGSSNSGSGGGRHSGENEAHFSDDSIDDHGGHGGSGGGGDDHGGGK